MNQFVFTDKLYRDVVEFGPGPVPADMRLVESRDILVDNSTITGDPEPQPRQVSIPHTTEVKHFADLFFFQVEMTTENYLMSENLVFYGTTVVDGEGVGVVVRTGISSFTFRCLLQYSKSVCHLRGWYATGKNA